MPPSHTSKRLNRSFFLEKQKSYKIERVYSLIREDFEKKNELNFPWARKYPKILGKPQFNLEDARFDLKDIQLDSIASSLLRRVSQFDFKCSD